MTAFASHLPSSSLTFISNIKANIRRDADLCLHPFSLLLFLHRSCSKDEVRELQRPRDLTAFLHQNGTPRGSALLLGSLKQERRGGRLLFLGFSFGLMCVAAHQRRSGAAAWWDFFLWTQTQRGKSVCFVGDVTAASTNTPNASAEARRHWRLCRPDHEPVHPPPLVSLCTSRLLVSGLHVDACVVLYGFHVACFSSFICGAALMGPLCFLDAHCLCFKSCFFEAIFFA